MDMLVSAIAVVISQSRCISEYEEVVRPTYVKLFVNYTSVKQERQQQNSGQSVFCALCW